MARRRLEGLERVLGTNALFATAYGNVGSSIYYALGLVAGLALGLTPVVFVITGFFFFCTAASYAEATTMYPEAGGSSSFARRAFNEFWSFFAAWGQMLNYVVTIAISALFVAHYLGGALGQDWLQQHPGDRLAAAVAIAVLAAINVLGAQESAALNVVLAVVDFFTQLLLVLIGGALVLAAHGERLIANVHLGVAPTWQKFVLSIPIGMIAYTGIETISNMAEEAKDYARTIPAAINRVRLAVFAIYLTLPAIALTALPVERVGHSYQTLLGVQAHRGDPESGFAGDPILGVVTRLHLGVLQQSAEVYVGLLAATILFLATNAGLIGISRLVYSMGIHRQMPDQLRRLHRRFRTPWIGILVFAASATAIMALADANSLGFLYAFGAMLSFTVAHLAVVRLRVTRPDVPRPYRGPGNVRVGHWDLPLFAVFGGAGTLLAFVAVAALHPKEATVGTAWLVVGVVIYVTYRSRQGLDLASTHKIAIPQPVIEHEAEYDSMLVPVSDGRYDAHVLGTAAKLAARRRRGIHILALVTVPSALPLDAQLIWEDAAARSAIEQARLFGGRRVTGHIERVRPGQAARRIIEEATDMRAAAIIMALPRREHAASLFGKTLETVLAERPCRIIIGAGGDAPMARSGHRESVNGAETR